MPHQLLPPGMPGQFGPGAGAMGPTHGHGYNPHQSPGQRPQQNQPRTLQGNVVHSPPSSRGYPHPGAGAGAGAGAAGPTPNAYMAQQQCGMAYPAPAGAGGGGYHPPRPPFGYPPAAAPAGQVPPPRQPGGQLPYRRFQNVPALPAMPNQISPPRPVPSMVSSSPSRPNGAPSAVVSRGGAPLPPLPTNNTISKRRPTPPSAVVSGSSPSLRSIEHSDSAEDIAASALLLCGGGAGRRINSPKSKASEQHSAIKRNIGSPSFEESRASSALSQLQTLSTSSDGGGSKDKPAVTTADAVTSVTTEANANAGAGPSHVSPVSTASHDSAEHEHHEEGTATPNSTNSAGAGGGGEQHLSHCAKLEPGAHIATLHGAKRTNASAAAAAAVVVAEPVPSTVVAKLPHFPTLLHDVLSRSVHAGTVLEWLPHGQGWRVLRWDDMCRTVIPEHFPDFIGRGAGRENGSATAGGADGSGTSNVVSAQQSRDEEEEGGNASSPSATAAADAAASSPTAGAKQADIMNSFLWHVRAWGFREVRDVGPDMGSYRHSLFLRGNPNLSLQMRLTGPVGGSSSPKVPSSSTHHASPASVASTEATHLTGTPNSHYSALQVPSLTKNVVNNAATASPGGMGGNKRKIGQVVSGDSSAAAPSSPQHHFHHQQQRQQGQGHVRKISDGHQYLPGIFRHGAPPPPQPSRGGGRISSSRGRNRKAGGGAAARPSALVGGPQPQLPPHPAAAARTSVDRRDETEQRLGPSPATTPAPPAAPAASASKGSFPVSTRGKGGRGRAVLRAHLPAASVRGGGSVVAPAHEGYSVGERVSAAAGKGPKPQQQQPSSAPPMMMKGVTSAAAAAPASAVPPSEQYRGVAVAVSRKSKKARLQGAAS